MKATDDTGVLMTVCHLDLSDRIKLLDSFRDRIDSMLVSSIPYASCPPSSRTAGLQKSCEPQGKGAAAECVPA